MSNDTIMALVYEDFEEFLTPEEINGMGRDINWAEMPEDF